MEEPIFCENIINYLKLEPVILDIMNLRIERQRINDILAYNSIKNGNLIKNINVKECERSLHQMNITKEIFLDKCLNDDIFAKCASGRITINASRQGSHDECLQLTTCNITSSKVGINIENLSATAFRATKNGEIISYKQFQEQEIQKNDCLKSFDGKISGKINGWIFAKLVIGDGGHQDNVFEEAHTFCEWVLTYGIETIYYFVLIDTDLDKKFNELYQKYSNKSNIIIGNHITIQQYFIDNYSLL